MLTREEQLKAAQAALQASKFNDGLVLAENLLADQPSDPEALYLAAVANRYLGRHADAEKHLSLLHRAMPEYGRAWQEVKMGSCHYHSKHGTGNLINHAVVI